MQKNLVLTLEKVLTNILCYGIAMYFCFVLVKIILIPHDVKERISIAQHRYPGTAEEALIAYLVDSTNSPIDRSNIAIWTLGQIGSKKALPILKVFYKNDPKVKTCHGKHNSVLCQKELYEAIDCIEHNYGFGLSVETQ